MCINIRIEKEEDYKEVESLVKKAFENAEHSDYTEHLLVNRLRKGSCFIEELSLVAEMDDKIVGHCLLTKAKIDDGINKFDTLALAPVSVLPQYQGKGVGSKLIKEAFKKAQELEFTSIIVLGHDKYYPRFGFIPASNYKITAPFEVPDESFMAIELKKGALKDKEGTLIYAKEFFE